MQNGNYTLAASSPSFKNVTLDFTIDNSNLTETIAFEPVSKSSPPPPVAPKTTSNAYLYAIIAVVAIVVIAALVLLIRKRAGK